MNDVVITISSVATNNEGVAYAYTQVFRLDIDMTAFEFMNEVLKIREVVHTEQLVAKQE